MPTRVKLFEFSSFDPEWTEATSEQISRAANRNAAGEKGEIAEPTGYTEEDLQRKEQEGYQRGLTEGTAQGQKQAEDLNNAAKEQLAQAVTALVSGLAPLEEKMLAQRTEQKDLLVRLALGAAQKVAGSALENAPEAKIKEVVEQSLGLIQNKGEVMLYVNPAMEAAAQECAKAHANTLKETTLTVLCDPNISAAQCRMEWNDGGAQNNIEMIWQEIEKILEENL